MTISLQLMTVEDYPDVVRWLARPHVRRWWQLDYDLAAVAAKYGPRLRGEEPTRMLVIDDDGTSVGLTQWYRWDDYAEDRDNYGIGAGELGMDYAIGLLSACGRGVGTQVVAQVLDAMREVHPCGTPVTVPPQATNAASCRVLEKNAFVQVATRQGRQRREHAPEGPVAVYRRPL
jgi:aminoglycoside 6'-N-acetyltransferase